MPKERISGEDDFDLEIRWGRSQEIGGQEVSVGVLTNTGKSLVHQLYDRDDTLARIGSGVRKAIGASAESVGDVLIGRNVLDIVSVGGYGGQLDHGFESIFASLDWVRANNAIRVFKRARDMAFGRPA